MVLFDSDVQRGSKPVEWNMSSFRRAWNPVVQNVTVEILRGAGFRKNSTQPNCYFR